MRSELTSDLALRILSRWWVAFAASAVFVVSGHLLIKAGLNTLPVAVSGEGMAVRLLHGVLQPEVLSGLFIYLLGTVCWMRTVSLKEISFVYPLSSINYVLVVAASTMLFHEMISARRAGGVLLIVLGTVLMTRQSREGQA